MLGYALKFHLMERGWLGFMFRIDADIGIRKSFVFGTNDHAVAKLVYLFWHKVGSFY
jgi:hypothetical protein